MISHHRSYGTLTTLPPSRAIASSFVCGALSGRDDRRRHAELARGPGDALRHVAGARRDDPLGGFRVRRLPDRVDGAADLERADRLQVLELEPDLRRPFDRETQERRPDRGAGDRLAGALDLGERNQNSTSVPTPCSRALRTISSAAARSSTARPSDLKTVSSSRVRAARMGADQHLAELGTDVLLAEPGEQQVARLVQGRLAPVDEEAGRGHRLGVELADRRQAGADGVHMGARGQPVPPQDRLARARAGADHVRAAEHLLRRAAVAAAPRADLGVAENGTHRLGVRARLDAGAEDRDDPRVWTRERACRHRRNGSRADLGDRRGVQDRAELPGLAVVEQHRPLVRIEPARGIPGRDHDLLQRPDGAIAAAVRRHEAHQALRIRRARHEPQRLVQLAARQRAQDGIHRLDALVHRQQATNIVL